MSSGKVYAYWSSTYPTAYWVFEWSSESIGAGKTRVSWSVYKGGRATSPSWLDTWCDLSLYYNKSWGKDPLWQSGTLTGSAASFNPQDNITPATTGQFEIEHEIDGTGSFEVYMTGRIHENEIKITRQWQSVEKNLPYSKCSNPSNVAISPSVQKPGGIITVSWEQPEGAENVASYDVWYQIGGTGTWYKNNTTSLSTIFVLPDTAARGKDIQACVRALGKGGSQYNSEDVYSDKDASRVNELPATPKVASNVEKVPSTGGEVIFSNFEYGEDEELYYSKGLLGAKSKINYEQLQVTVGENTDFYFWTWDGLEYCQNPCIKSVSLNTKPQITGCLVDSPDSNGMQKIKSITPSFAKAHWKISFGNPTSEFNGEAEGTNFSVDVFKALSEINGGLEGGTLYNYYLSIQAFDGIEWTDFYKVTPNAESSSPYSITAPTVTCLNDNGFFAPFSRKLSIKIADSFSIIGATFSDDNKLSNNNPSSTWEVNTEGIKYDADLDYISVGNSNDETAAVRFNVKSGLSKVKEFWLGPPGQGSVFGNDALFNVHSDNSVTISLQKFDSDYGFANGSAASLKVSVGNWEVTLASESGKDFFQYTLNKGHLDALYAKIIKNNPQDSLELLLTLTNDFDDSVTNQFTLNLNYYKEATIIDVALYPSKPSNDPSESPPELDAWGYLKEGMAIWGKIEFTTFYKPTLLLLSNGFESQIWTDEEWVEKMVEERTSPYKYNRIIDFGSIPKTLEDVDSVYFTLKIETPGQKVAKKELHNDYTIRAYREPRVQFTELSYNGKNLIGKWKINDIGWAGDDTKTGEMKLDFQVQESSEIKVDPITISGIEGSFNINFVFDSFELLHIAPKLTTTMSSYYTNTSDNSTILGFETTKTTDQFEYMIVYNKLPTVSYRSNYLGINTSFDDETPTDTTIQIGAYNSRDKIYLKGAEKTACVDLNKGALVSFIVDCGSWSGVPGGIIPGGDTPEGLAAVAYSGDIAHLNQNSQTVIIFSGGGAPGVS